MLKKVFYINSKMKDLNQTTIKKDASETKINPIIIYALEHCPYCKNATKLLDSHKIKYNKIIIENDDKIKEKYKKQCAMDTFPMIFIQNPDNEKKYIKLGGFSDLQTYIQLSNQLEENNININILKALNDLL